jgi:hypothetical protein
VQAISGHKLLSLAYQMASRLASSVGDHGFQKPLSRLLTRLGSEHPHHVLIFLFALKSQTDTPAAKDKAVAASDVLIVCAVVPACCWVLHTFDSTLFSRAPDRLIFITKPTLSSCIQ